MQGVRFSLAKNCARVITSTRVSIQAIEVKSESVPPQPLTVKSHSTATHACTRAHACARMHARARKLTHTRMYDRTHTTRDRLRRHDSSSHAWTSSLRWQAIGSQASAADADEAIGLKRSNSTGVLELPMSVVPSCAAACASEVALVTAVGVAGTMPACAGLQHSARLLLDMSGAPKPLLSGDALTAELPTADRSAASAEANECGIAPLAYALKRIHEATISPASALEYREYR
jgi:hypothetical protein